MTRLMDDEYINATTTQSRTQQQGTGGNPNSASGTGAGRRGANKTREQTEMFEAAYLINKQLDGRKQSLAAATGLTDKQVHDWFNNKRAKERREALASTTAPTRIDSP